MTAIAKVNSAFIGKVTTYEEFDTTPCTDCGARGAVVQSEEAVGTARHQHRLTAGVRA